MTPPAAPPDPAAYRKPQLMGTSFWAFIAFSVVCVGAGAGVAVFVPQLLSQRLHPAAARSAPRLFDPVPPAAPGVPAPPALPAAETPADAVADARAVAVLAEAARGSQPFAEALAPLAGRRRLAGDVAALRLLAASGAPSRAALAVSFPDDAARAVAVARAPEHGAGFLAQARYALGRIVTLRRVGDVGGAGLDAVFARAERMACDGDVEAALKVLQALPPAAREAMAPWRERAERRVEVDRRIAALGDLALSVPAPTTGDAP